MCNNAVPHKRPIKEGASIIHPEVDFVPSTGYTIYAECSLLFP